MDTQNNFFTYSLIWSSLRELETNSEKLLHLLNKIIKLLKDENYKSLYYINETNYDEKNFEMFYKMYKTCFLNTLGSNIVLQTGKFEKEFTKKAVFGKGSFGLFYKVRNKIDHREYALKKIRIIDIDIDITRIQIWATLSNQFIVQYKSAWFEELEYKYDFYYDDDDSITLPHYSKEFRLTLNNTLFIQMELCETSLDDILIELNNELNINSENGATCLGFYLGFKLFMEIINGVNYLHTQNPPIIHGNIKMSNILIKKHFNNTKFIKLSEFCFTNKNLESNEYTAPEILEGKKFNELSDMYSIGIVMSKIFLITNKRLSELKQLLKINQKLIVERFNGYVNLNYNDSDMLNVVQEIGDRFSNIISLLSENPDYRPNSLEIMKNPTYYSIDFDSIKKLNQLSTIYYNLIEKKCYTEILTQIFDTYFHGNLKEKSLSLSDKLCRTNIDDPAITKRMSKIITHSVIITDTTEKLIEFAETKLNVWKCIALKTNEQSVYLVIDSLSKHAIDYYISFNKINQYLILLISYENFFIIQLLYNKYLKTFSGINNENELKKFISFMNKSDKLNKADENNYLFSKKNKTVKNVIESYKKYQHEVKILSVLEKYQLDIKLFYIPNANEILFVTFKDEACKFFSFGKTESLICLEELKNKRIIKYSSSYTNYFALSYDGSVYSWGNNEYGQLGCGHTQASDKPLLIKTALKELIKDICCGYYHTILLTVDGKVKTFGRNTFGQIGNNSTENQLIPLTLDSDEISFAKIIAISCGFDHSIALNSNGKVFVWGDNSYGQLGIINSDKQLSPKKLSISSIVQIMCGRFSSVMLLSNGDIYFCGYVSKHVKLTVPTKINKTVKFKEIAASPYFHLCVALSVGNCCYVFGSCEKGNFAEITETKFKSLDEAFIFYINQILTYRNIDRQKNSITPRKSNELMATFNNNWPNICKYGLNYVSKLIVVFECTEDKAIFIDKNRAIYTLSLSNNKFFKNKPTLIAELKNKEVLKIACGREHTLLLTSDQEVFSFGNNRFGQLGHSSDKIKNNKPLKVSELSDECIIDITCGDYFSIALNKSGKIFVWGDGKYGQIGNGSDDQQLTPCKIKLLVNEKIVSISCGRCHCLALTENGLLYGWGDNFFGQLGIGKNYHQNIPKLVPIEQSIKIKKICCGDYHSLLLTTDNVIYYCGKNKNEHRIDLSTFKTSDSSFKIFSKIPMNILCIHRYFIKLENTPNFIDIETNKELSLALTSDHKYYILSESEWFEPRETKYKSFNELIISLKRYNNNFNNAVVENLSLKESKEMLLKILLSKEIENIAQEISSISIIQLQETKGLFASKQNLVYTLRLNESIEESQNGPIVIIDKLNIQIKRAICAHQRLLYLTECGKVFSYYINHFNEANNFEQKVSELNDECIIDISCGAYHFLALNKRGKLFMWGSVINTQTGNESIETTETPIQIKSLNDLEIIAISCGENHSLALSSDNNLYGWGHNSYGQLGFGNFENQFQPKLIEKQSNVVIKKISCGRDYSLVLTDDYAIYSFGSNHFGQLGIGNTGDQNIMTKIETSIKFVDICTNWYDNISAGSSQSGIYYIWGKCGDERITTPKQTYFTSFDEMFAKFSSDRFVSKQ